MRTTAFPAATTAEAPTHADRLSHLNDVIESAAHLLPAQGPITVFIHHNTLHGFEEFSFHEGVKRGAAVFGCQPYLTEDRYRDELRRGRIRFDKLQTVLRATWVTARPRRSPNLGPDSSCAWQCFSTRYARGRLRN